MDKIYPKVLIIGNYINLRQGGGITLYNLLKGWDKSKIAIVSNKVDEEGLDICTKYYRLGYDENKRPWPFNKFQPYYKSEPVNFTEQKKKNEVLNNYAEKRSKYNRSFKTFFWNLLHFFGIYYFIFPLRVSEKFLNWIEHEKPDIIYTQLTSPDIIFFMRELMTQISTPLFIHIMDDWPKVVNKSGISHLYWNRKVQNDFKWLMQKSSGLLSICDAMGDEYFKRYGHKFISFHNCIDIGQWNKNLKSDYSISEKFIILYAGRIGLGTSQSILTFARAVENLKLTDTNVEFHIQSGSIPESHQKEISRLNRTKVSSFVKYEELPEKLSSVDMLLLPMDFDKTSLKFIHLSMPTKVPEYMATGVPIFVFADKSTALYRYAATDGWAISFGINNEKLLTKKLEEVIKNEVERKKVGIRATEMAYSNHDGEQVREQFRKYFIKQSGIKLSNTLAVE